MPELSRFNNIIISIQFESNGKHHKPHVHATYGDSRMSIAIDGEVLAGIFPPKQLSLVREWLSLHEEELYAAWNNAVRNLPVEKIEPLK